MGELLAPRTRTVVLGLLSVFSLLPVAHATGVPASPYQADMALSQVYQIANSPGSGRELEVVPTVKVQGRIRGLGFVDARYSLRRNKTWRATVRKQGREVVDPLNPVLLQGRLAVGGAWRSSGRRILPSAAAIIGKELRVTFPGRARGSKGSRQRVYTIKMTLDGSLVVKARVSSIPRSVGRRGACGAEVGSPSMATALGTDTAEAGTEAHSQSSVVPPLMDKAEVPETTLARVITISTDADQEWFRKYGDRSNAVIASLINTAEAVYNRQLGLRFRIVKQHVYSDSSPFVSSDAGDLLTTFTRNPENPVNLSDEPNSFHEAVDLKHLFTGKDIDGSIIGIAYIGVVCAVPSLSYGVTQDYMEVANAGIFAHELGHNFGASHDSSTREGIMYPSISIPPATKFSDVSLAEINGHLGKYGSCISLEQMAPRPDETPGPDPFPTPIPPSSAATIEIRRDRVGDPRNPVVRITGKVLTLASQPVGGVGIKLMVSGENIANAVTSEDGSFKFFIRLDLPKGRQVYVYAETEGGEVFSNFLWMSKTRPITQSRTRR
jgi:hypothetical protein